MNDRDSFLQAIRANPDDDHLRLIYADWLEERGDPRGEFIRVQIELAKEPDSRRQQTLVTRQEELLQVHRQEWLGPFVGLIQEERFERGFLAMVAVGPDTFVGKADELLHFEPVRTMRVRGVGPALGTGIEKVAKCHHLEKLTGLVIAAQYFPGLLSALSRLAAEGLSFAI